MLARSSIAAKGLSTSAVGALAGSRATMSMVLSSIIRDEPPEISPLMDPIRFPDADEASLNELDTLLLKM